jgi:outer membrane protein OmpA-like peptidoglycan-associated protein
LPEPRVATATPPLPAASPPAPGQPAPPSPTTPELPPGSDKLTLPFFVQDIDLPPAEQAMLRDFAHNRANRSMQYVVSAYAAAAPSDDDPSTPRRLALSRAQAVQAALLEAGVPGGRIRLLALGAAGGSPPDRVEIVASPSGASASPSPPSTH